MLWNVLFLDIIILEFISSLDPTFGGRVVRLSQKVRRSLVRFRIRSYLTCFKYSNTFSAKVIILLVKGRGRVYISRVHRYFTLAPCLAMKSNNRMWCIIFKYSQCQIAFNVIKFWHTKMQITSTFQLEF